MTDPSVRRFLKIVRAGETEHLTLTEERVLLLAETLEKHGPLREKELRSVLSKKVWNGYSQTLRRLLNKLRNRGHLRREEPEGHSRHVVYSVESGTVEQLKREHLQAVIEAQGEEDRFDTEELLTRMEEGSPHVRPISDLETLIKKRVFYSDRDRSSSGRD